MPFATPMKSGAFFPTQVIRKRDVIIVQSKPSRLAGNSLELFENGKAGVVKGSDCAALRLVDARER